MQKTAGSDRTDNYQFREDFFDLMMGTTNQPESLYGHDVNEDVVSAARRLLVVDDEARIRNAYQRIFSMKGFDVLTAPNAMVAKDMLVREKIGFVFLDINMAEVDGGILFELVRAFHPDVKVIVSSVYPIEEQKERIKDADAYFDKSDGKDVLLQMVSAMAG